MRIAITGGLGYLGGRLIAALAVRPDVAVRVLVRGERPIPAGFPQNIEIHHGSLPDGPAVRGFCNGITQVVHLAGLDQAACQRSPETALAVSGAGTLRLAEEAAAAGVSRFLFVSTFHVYGDAEGVQLHEDVALCPVTVYGVSRMVGEAFAHMVAARGTMKTVALRLANGFGPPAFTGTHAWELVVNDFCWQAVHKQQIVLRRSGKQKRDFLPVTDIVGAIEHFLGIPDIDLHHGTFNIGSGRIQTLLDVAKCVQAEHAAMSGITVPIRTGTDMESEPPMRLLDTTRASRAGFTPRLDVREEIRRTLTAAAGTAEAVGCS